MAGLDKLIEDALRAEIRAAVARVLATMGAATDDPPPAPAGGGDDDRGGRAVLAAVRGPRAPRRRAGGARLSTGERHHGRTVLRAAGRRGTGERRYRVRCDACGAEGAFSRSAIVRHGCRACAAMRRIENRSHATPAESAAMSGKAEDVLSRLRTGLPCETRIEGTAGVLAKDYGLAVDTRHLGNVLRLAASGAVRCDGLVVELVEANPRGNRYALWRTA